MINYEEIGTKIGIEVHNRLFTKEKLFCACAPRFSNEREKSVIVRNQRAVPGEMGKTDEAAQFEFLRNRTFNYQCYDKETCLVEQDEEPPHPVNREALEIVLQVCKVLKCEIPDEIHVMRKTVIDGSNTSGFQRTALVGIDGVLKTTKGDVGITNVCLEEESAGIVDKRANDVVYRLDRLGIPLIEVGTAPDIKDPEHACEVCEKIGMIIRSTGKSQRGLGVTRQDINVSVRGGARVEIKGVQDLDLIPKIIEEEVKRQQKLVLAGGSKEETRVMRQDGTTVYTRPLPGGERMYPETDIAPLQINKKLLAKIKLPESFEEKMNRFRKDIPKDLAEQMIKSEYLGLYEKLARKYDAKIVATTLLSIIKDLRRKGTDTSVLTLNHFDSVFFALKQNRISKEAIQDVLEAYCVSPEKTIGEIIATLGIETVDESEVRQMVRAIMQKYPKLVAERKIGALMGDIMKEARGKIDGKVVKKILEEEMS